MINLLGFTLYLPGETRRLRCDLDDMAGAFRRCLHDLRIEKRRRIVAESAAEELKKPKVPSLNEAERVFIDTLLRAANRARHFTGCRSAIFVGPRGLTGMRMKHTRIGEYGGCEIWVPQGAEVDVPK